MPRPLVTVGAFTGSQAGFELYKAESRDFRVAALSLKAAIFWSFS